MGKPIIMGRKTFQSLGKPLDGRTNIVVTRKPDFAVDGAVVTTSVEAALQAAGEALSQGATDVDVSGQSQRLGDEVVVDEAVVIGGAEIYLATLPLADRVYFTEIHARPDGDTYFPALDPEDWALQSSEPLDTGPRDDFAATLKVFERRS